MQRRSAEVEFNQRKGDALVCNTAAAMYIAHPTIGRKKRLCMNQWLLMGTHRCVTRETYWHRLCWATLVLLKLIRNTECVKVKRIPCVMKQ